MVEKVSQSALIFGFAMTMDKTFQEVILTGANINEQYEIG